MHIMQSRRDFLTTLSATGAATALGARTSLADEGPPEVTTLRLGGAPGICFARGYIAEELLRAEGFTDIRYIPDYPIDAVARGELDFDMETAAWVVSNVDAGQPITALAGVHVGCYELFAHEPIRTISDLKGKKVRIPQTIGSSYCGQKGSPMSAIFRISLSPQSHVARLISTITPRQWSSRTSTPASRSRRWRGCIPDVTSYSRTRPFKRSGT
jgi:hypothetical protein